MSDQYDLVDNVLQDMQQNNSAEVLRYQPNFDEPNSGGRRMPSDVQMADYDYDDAPSRQAPMPQRGQQMRAMRQVPEEQYAPDFDEMSDSERNTISQEELRVPDLSKYGQNESDGWFDDLFGELKGPMIIVVLAFAMSLPQINAVFRNLIVRFTTNPMYMNLSMAIILGAMFWVARRFLE